LNRIIVDQANSVADLGEVRELFHEYAASLEISLCFQNFEQELASLPGKYAPPEGRLFLARQANKACGCAALRPIDQGVCEMKRLYVRPAWRRQGLGRDLSMKIIAAAREIGYRCMRLDTLASMKSALSLYQSLGFRNIAPYYDNPSEKAVFMELLLGAPEYTRSGLRRKLQ
jgi:putative acetyltransferase